MALQMSMAIRTVDTGELSFDNLAAAFDPMTANAELYEYSEYTPEGDVVECALGAPVTARYNNGHLIVDLEETDAE